MANGPLKIKKGTCPVLILATQRHTTESVSRVGNIDWSLTKMGNNDFPLSRVGNNDWSLSRVGNDDGHCPGLEMPTFGLDRLQFPTLPWLY